MSTISYQLDGYTGYFYEWIEPLQTWILKWRPESGCYSPPLLDEGIKWFHMAVPSHIKSINALDLKKLAVEKDIRYLYYREDMKKLELWSNDLAASIVSLQGVFASLAHVSIRTKSLKD